MVDTPKGRLSRLEGDFLGQPWARVRDGVQVKWLATGEESCVHAQSDAGIDKERGGAASACGATSIGSKFCSARGSRVIRCL